MWLGLEEGRHRDTIFRFVEKGQGGGRLATVLESVAGFAEAQGWLRMAQRNDAAFGAA